MPSPALDQCQTLPKQCVAHPPQLNHTMALRQKFNSSSTNFRSNFEGKTISPRSMKICNTSQYKFLPVIFVVPILIPDFTNCYAVLHCVDVKSAQASSWSDLMTKTNISSPIALHILLDCKEEEGGGKGQGCVTPEAAVPSTRSAMTTKGMMIVITRRIMEVMMTIQFDWRSRSYWRCKSWRNNWYIGWVE